MIQHIFKIIWNERRSNLWILIELIFIFTILWFCSDYISYMFQRHSEPLGYDIEHTYILDIGIDENLKSELLKDGSITEQELLSESGWTIFERVKKSPIVEVACLSQCGYPYFGGSMSMNYIIDGDTVKKDIETIRVTPEYFDVYKIKMQEGKHFTWDNFDENLAVITGDRQDDFGKKNVNEVKSLTNDSPEDSKQSKVIGTAKFKRDPYTQYYAERAIFPISRKELNISNQFQGTVSIRVSPQEDNSEFRNRFLSSMSDQLNVGPFFLAGIKSLDDVRAQYMEWNAYEDNIKSVSVVSLFLIVNIFLGIIGTFWFRVQARRSEIGLRMALGSNKREVQMLFIQETLLLLFIASVIGAAIAFNISLTEFIKELGVPSVPQDSNHDNLKQYCINYLLTFGILAFIAVLAVWYPVRKASQIQPAKALHEE